MIVNLKDYYPDYYKQKYEVDVPDEVAFWLEEFKRLEKNWEARMKYHFVIYSLDCNDNIEGSLLFPALTPEQILVNRTVESEQSKIKNKMNHLLYEALALLTETQRKRIYCHCVLGMSKAEIAELENVKECSVRESIMIAFKKIKKYFSKNA